jgi:hypothetical protein
MHGWMDGSDWLWMTMMMGLWLVLLGAVVYMTVRLVTVRLAQRPPTKPRSEYPPDTP